MATSSVYVQFSFLCELRGYHQYRIIWNPILSETFPARREIGNAHDRYAIAGYKKFGLFEKIIGHLPREISRYIHFIILHGATISIKVVDVSHRRSPLIQGGLEIPVKVTVSMTFSEANKLAMKRCEVWVELQYKEPVNDQFEDATAEILEILHGSDSENSLTDESSDDDDEQSDD